MNKYGFDLFLPCVNLHTCINTYFWLYIFTDNTSHNIWCIHYLLPKSLLKFELFHLLHHNNWNLNSFIPFRLCKRMQSTQNFSSLAIESCIKNKCNICIGGENSSAWNNRQEVGWGPEPVQMPCRCKTSMPKKINCFMAMKWYHIPWHTFLLIPKNLIYGTEENKFNRVCESQLRYTFIIWSQTENKYTFK